MGIHAVNLAEKFDTFFDHWNPRVVGELNGQAVKIAKVKGEFVMHKHDNEDEMFLVLEGLLHIEFEDKVLEIKQGEFTIIPRGVLHRPKAQGEVKLLLFEPISTLNTGNVRNEMTKENLHRI